jgi:hypothetical protein
MTFLGEAYPFSVRLGAGIKKGWFDNSLISMASDYKFYWLLERGKEMLRGKAERNISKRVLAGESTSTAM